MKRVVEKVKDIVDVRPFTHLNDFAADPILTLSGYHFTDITSDLMAKWIDRLADVRNGRGEALALAGFRGVGKSHFLAVIGALVSRPELRSGVTDPHVRSAVGRLSRRHNPVAFVRRGTCDTLLDELKQALAKVINCPPGTLPDSPEELLSKAAAHAGELPLVLLIDTELGRDARVSRDDGGVLSTIAALAHEMGIFVGVALDDDISGADGPNSSIASSFSIDYLDQEHLYKVVGANIFAKQSQMLPLLHDIYTDYRAALPGFRWSEQRFSSLYPLHPATIEIAPIIRLYIHDFALLGFAAEAGLKILGRPANSLIGLDEVFDGVESRLRNVAELDEAFVAFDKLQNEVIAKTPVHVRLPAKLILKGLFLLSLDGRGSTATDIAASMMIVEDQTASTRSLDVAKLLDSFSAALPDFVERTEGLDREVRYRFKLTSRLDSGDILAELAADVSDDVIWAALLRQTAEKFSDIEVTSDLGDHPTHCKVEWRGGVRRGSIVWAPPGVEDHSVEKGEYDWSVVVENSSEGEPSPHAEGYGHSIRWKIAPLTSEEKDTVRRHHLLQTSHEAREQLGDAVTTASHAHSIAVEKVWQRVMIADARLVDGQTQYEFDESVLSALSLSQLFTPSLAPIFESRFPAHPRMSFVLDPGAASALITNFFSTADLSNPDIQRLAEGCAAPLGLAIKDGDIFVPTAEDVVSEMAIVKTAFEGLGKGPDATISLHELSSRMQAAPFGYTREARQLVAASLVAQRQFDFVTTSGDRINHRSLDLRIVWDDIEGLAKPLNELYSKERLVSWARLVSGNPEISSVDAPADKALIVEALTAWLTNWREDGILDSFDALSDENLNAGIWRTAASLRKSYGAIADTAATLIRGDISVEECLQAIADLFSDLEPEFEKKKGDLQLLSDFLAGVAIRNEIVQYLSISEMTDEAAIETKRQDLMNALMREAGTSELSPKTLGELWSAFKSEYVDHYIQRHDAVMSPSTSVKTLKDVLNSNDWSVFENLSSNPYFDRQYSARARTLSRELRQLYCLANVKEVLEATPGCTCSFELCDYDRLAAIGDHLRNTLSNGIEQFRQAAIHAGAMTADADLNRFTGGDSRRLNIAGKTTGNADPAFSDSKQGQERMPVPDGVEDWGQEIEQLEVFANT
ncbi:MAG: hypothetical protein ABIV21_05215 [Pyrinomonadaceae bacterium]